MATLTQNSTQQLFFLVTIAQARAAKVDSLRKNPRSPSFIFSLNAWTRSSSIHLYDACAHICLGTHTHGPTNALGLRQCWFWRHFTQTRVWPREMSNTASQWLLLQNRCALLARKNQPSDAPKPSATRFLCCRFVWHHALDLKTMSH